MHPEEVSIDYNADIFWTMTKERFDLKKYVLIKNKQLRNQLTNTSPCFVHVPYIRKYYPVFLEIAYQLGIRLSSRNVDLVLFHQKKQKNVPNIDAHVIELTPRVKTDIEKDFFYRYMIKKENLIKGYYRLRKLLGKYRRQLLRK